MLFLCVAFRITIWSPLSNSVSISIFTPPCLPVTLYLCRSAFSPPFSFLLRQCEWNALTTGLTFLKSTHAPNQQHSICIGSLLSLCNIFTFFPPPFCPKYHQIPIPPPTSASFIFKAPHCWQ